MITLENIEKSYGDKCVLAGVSLVIPRGVTASLSGMSGSGKTTLFRIAAGLETPEAGTVSVSGRTAAIFAEPRLFAAADVMENVTCVMRGNKRENRRRAGELLSSLGLEAAAGLRPRALSSGMAARVAIARAVAYEADAYFLDEPFKSLDGESKMLVMGVLKPFFRDKAVFFITHDVSEAAFLAGRHYHLSDGRISETKMFSK